MSRDTKQAFAIVRFDAYLPDETDVVNRVKVKRIVWSEEEAKGEVDRLAKLGTDECVYFWQVTKVDASS